MKTGYCNPRARFTLKAQAGILLAAGVPENRIYVEGERGETFEAACKGARDKTVHCPDGLRVFGTSQKAIRAALIDAERRGIIIIDATTGQRSDKAPWKMYDQAVGKGQAEDRKLDRRKSRKGGNGRAAKLEADRLVADKAEAIWKNLKRYATDQDACDAMNELHKPQISGGWNPQMARRHFKASGRPRGNRAFKLRKE